MRNLLLSLSLTGLLLTPGDKITDDFYHHPEHILVSAHRADHAHFPENSLGAIRAAIKAGIDIVELDVRETKDGQLVLMHDSKVDRTTNGKGKVEDLTYAELGRLFLKLGDTLKTTERIPSFEAALLAAKDRIMIDIDFKAETASARASVYKLVEKYGMQKQVLFFVYDVADIAPALALDSTLPIMPRVHNAREVAQVLQMRHFPVLHVDDSFYSDSLVAVIRNAHTRVWANALGDYDDMEEVRPGSGFDEICRKRQLNVIQTNYPEELLAYLRKHGKHR